MVKQLKRALTKEWEQLVEELPVDLESSAHQYQALCRRREIKSSADLLRLILIYALSLSLTTTAVWAVGLQLGNLSRQALDKRILKSRAWLEYLLAALLHQVVLLSSLQLKGIKRLWLRDASVMSRPGSPGTQWRLHLSWFPCLTACWTTPPLSYASCGLLAGAVPSNLLTFFSLWLFHLALLPPFPLKLTLMGVGG